LQANREIPLDAPNCSDNTANWLHSIGTPTEHSNVCHLQAAYAHWDPRFEPTHSCGDPWYKVTVSEFFISVVLANSFCANPRCTLDGYTWTSLPSVGELVFPIPQVSSHNVQQNGKDFLKCECNGAPEYFATGAKVSEMALSRVQSFLPVATEQAWNIVYVMFDAVSRAHFYRALPNTVSF
jgi:hypothetical protein